MSRSGYSDDCEGWDLIRWRGAVRSAIRGKRGQAFLRKLITALDALPEKRLIANELQTPDGDVCAIGSVGRMQGIDMNNLDPGESEEVGVAFNISPALVKETAYVNDEWSYRVTPEERFTIVRKWAASQIIARPDPGRGLGEK